MLFHVLVRAYLLVALVCLLCASVLRCCGALCAHYVLMCLCAYYVLLCLYPYALMCLYTYALMCLCPYVFST